MKWLILYETCPEYNYRGDDIDWILEIYYDFETYNISKDHLRNARLWLESLEPGQLYPFKGDMTILRYKDLQ